MHLSSSRKIFKGERFLLGTGLVMLAAVSLSGCANAWKTVNGHEAFTSGYVVDQQALDMVPVGSSREQVLLALGTPSTEATFDNDAFYYISQKRVRSMAFQNPHIVSQHVLAVYFGPDQRVTKLANYGLKDGKLFDFISKTTPTGGKETTFLGQLITGLAGQPQLEGQPVSHY
jgi:outer membrane protein assembly factor BamE (lipoprotein component of BamABCDE complex)